MFANMCERGCLILHSKTKLGNSVGSLVNRFSLVFKTYQDNCSVLLLMATLG